VRAPAIFSALRTQPPQPSLLPEAVEQQGNGQDL
jgi:hypothetical protein